VLLGRGRRAGWLLVAAAVAASGVALPSAMAGLVPPLPSPSLPVPEAEPPADLGGTWLAGDLHVHTTYSHDSYGGPSDDNTGPDEAYTAGLTVAQQFTLAASRGLDYVAITDHNDVRSQSDPGFGAHGVVGVGAYENSLDGHAQMLGADQVYDRSLGAAAQRDALQADGGVFQINHPVEGGEVDWGPGHSIVPDAVEVWNISRLYQPPLPSASDNDAAVRFWEQFLDAGHRVAATGGSDSHWASTVAIQGVGSPTTWVFASEATEAGVLDGVRAGRTMVSARPPAQGGARVFLEADVDGDGTFEAMVGDAAPVGTAMRARVDGAPGAELRIITDGGTLATPPVAVTTPIFEHRFRAPAGTWVRAEVARPDLADERGAVCGDATSYCRNLLLVEAMTSALYLVPAVTTELDDGAITLSNGLVARTWSLEPFRTISLVDLRTGRRWSEGSPDFRLVLDGAEVASDQLAATAPPDIEQLDDGGVRVTFDLGIVHRIVETWPDVAGFRSRTVLQVPGVLSGYTLDEAAVGSAAATAHSFRAGADWRSDEGWEPALAVGDANTGDWRRTVVAERGAPLAEPGQWVSLRAEDGARLFMVMERAHLPSSRVRYDGEAAAALVDLSRDVIGLGPIEEDAHVQNPGPGPARHRVVQPGLALEAVFTGVAVDGDDEPWQHWAYLSRHRMPPWPRAVTFNTNNVDGNRISTGAKDDVDFATFRAQLDVARRLGVETFVFDDGWQARSGDWCPDSPACPEPRAATYGHRFPDERFEAVRAELGDMRLGLWMSPMHFHTSSDAFTANPQWACTPVGDGTAALTALQPEDGSNEAGLGTWNPLALGTHPDTGEPLRAVDHVEGRIRRAIEVYGATYFKLDFLVWLDCVDAAPVDVYEYREAFAAMLDRLLADHPTVTFQVDETNDYRLFPFESIARGPSWFQNGTPAVSQLLHNVWSLAPEVPGFTLGQHVLSNAAERSALPTDFLMAASLGSHITFWDDLTTLTDEQVVTARSWVDLYKGHRDRLATFAYPLLDDPAGGTTWTALQPWDRDADRGMLLVYRQDHADGSRRVPLRGLRDGSRYLVRDVRSGAELGSFSAEELRTQGLLVTLPARWSAAVLAVDPIG
jgi:hypothetical protein